MALRALWPMGTHLMSIIKARDSDFQGIEKAPRRASFSLVGDDVMALNLAKCGFTISRRACHVHAQSMYHSKKNRFKTVRLLNCPLGTTLRLAH